MVSERLTTTEGLKVGDVVSLATTYRDRRNGEMRWWTRFAIVTGMPVTRHHVTLTRLQPDMSDPDERQVDIEEAVVRLIPSTQWPQGVSAMVMKAIAKRQIELP
jgi:hypothetical protein